MVITSSLVTMLSFICLVVNGTASSFASREVTEVVLLEASVSLEVEEEDTEEEDEEVSDCEVDEEDDEVSELVSELVEVSDEVEPSLLVVEDDDDEVDEESPLSLPLSPDADVEVGDTSAADERRNNTSFSNTNC